MSTAILNGFLLRLSQMDQPHPIAWPGLHFDPPATGFWLKAKLFPNEPDDPFWQGDSVKKARGYFQVTAFTRPGSGEVELSQLADDVLAHFPKALHIDQVYVQMAWKSPAIEEEDRILIPVTIRYTGMVN